LVLTPGALGQSRSAEGQEVVPTAMSIASPPRYESVKYCVERSIRASDCLFLSGVKGRCEHRAYRDMWNRSLHGPEAFSNERNPSFAVDICAFAVISVHCSPGPIMSDAPSQNRVHLPGVGDLHKWLRSGDRSIAEPSVENAAASRESRMTSAAIRSSR
jgi:hypothetical protein